MGRVFLPNSCFLWEHFASDWTLSVFVRETSAERRNTQGNVLQYFCFGSVTAPFLSLGRESSFSFRTFTGLPCAWPKEEYWVFLENFLRATTLSYFSLCTEDFPSNAACRSQVIVSQIFLEIQHISISKDLIGKRENK